MNSIDLNAEKVLDKYPLLISVAGTFFTASSIANRGLYFEESVFIFAYGILSSLIRQIGKDLLIKHGHLMAYHLVQLVLFIFAVFIFVNFW